VPIKVMIVDDSAFMRRVLTQMLESDPDICVVGTARDGEDALARIERFAPDVLTLDLEMPKMDGLTFLSKVMTIRPTPILVVSSLAINGAEQTMRALEMGAVDFVTKPVAIPSEDMLDIRDELLLKVKYTARANLTGADSQSRSRVVMPFIPKKTVKEHTICCLAASTGGPKALQSIVSHLPIDFPAGILLVQHMPPGFTSSFAERLGERPGMPVREARDGDPILPGMVFLAPSGQQTQVMGTPEALWLRVGSEPSSLFHPSADITFASIAESCGSHGVGVILTGMGQDGARGLLTMRNTGAYTIAESAETCVINGMPRAAIELGAAEVVLPLWQIPEALRMIFVTDPSTDRNM